MNFNDILLNNKPCAKKQSITFWSESCNLFDWKAFSTLAIVNHEENFKFTQLPSCGGTFSATVIVVGNKTSDSISNPRQSCLCFSNPKHRIVTFIMFVLKTIVSRAIVILFRCLSYFGARGVMVTVLGNGHGDTSSNPGRD